MTLRSTLLLVIPVLTSLIVSCGGSDPNAFTLNGTAQGGFEDGTKVFLRFQDSLGTIQTIDTTSIESGQFSFQGTSDNLDLKLIEIEGQQPAIRVFLEPGKIKAVVRKDSLQFARVEGTPENDALMAYQDLNKEFSDAMQGVQEDFQVAIQSGDTISANSLREEMNEISSRAAERFTEFVGEHPENMVSAFVLRDLAMVQYRRKQQGVDFIDDKRLKEVYDGLDVSVQESRYLKGVGDLVETWVKTGIGVKAPAFSGPTPEGGSISLEEYIEDKVVLVDFWAGWCRPCRMENPNVVRVYNKFKDKGFTVLGVSLDDNPEVWKSAIADDQLNWGHVSNLMKYQDPIAQEYGVSAIPASFLLDRNGVIIARNLRGPALEAKVAEVLGSGD